MRNAHGIPVPDAGLPLSLGDDAKSFAKKIIDDMRLYSNDDLLQNLLDGHGARIAGKLPGEFWDMVAEVAKKVSGRPVTLQLNSADPYVPWELALVKNPIDASRPTILAAQTAMGRWILGSSDVAAPPRGEVRVTAMAAMAGQYSVVDGLRPLPAAIEEVAELKKTYGAIPVTCDSASIKALLGGAIGGGVQAVHFAGHGQVDPSRPGDAAIYIDKGKPLTPTFFRYSKLGHDHAPFIFFNACMVGTAGELLGDFGGFPGECLSGGFSALVAPLWAVDDAVAKWMALSFYESALAKEPRPVAEILQDLRASYDSDAPASSYLAYVYYGNPRLTLTRQ
jgi:hypothetical protein